MVLHKTLGSRFATFTIYTVLIAMAVLCVLPLLNVFAVSLSSNSAIEAGRVSLWPVDVTLSAYEYVAKKEDFLASINVSLVRLALGVSISMLVTVLTAYPLSKEYSQFKGRTWFSWYFVFTILFGGGFVPTYVIVRNLGLIDSIWALVLPGAVPVFNIILLLNFMRSLPKEMLEASFIDGAGHWSVLMRIVVPLSMPAIATVTLFAIVGNWNEWFNGLLYMNSPEKYPLASYLQTVVVKLDLVNLSKEQIELLGSLNNRSVKAAQIFLSALPVLIVYPFLQRYFMSGIVMGSVKE